MSTDIQTRTLLCSLGLLLTVLILIHGVIGQQVGLSLELLGVNLPNNSLVEVRDLYDVNTRSGLVPTHETGRQFPTLHCFTDLVDCCNLPRATDIGEWYFPNGTALDFDLGGTTTFRRNRGPNGPYGPNGELVYGVIRLFRRGLPPERGRFWCEAPTAAGCNETLYANILDIGPVTITASGGSNTGSVGTNFSLECSATVETQSDTPTPNFDWFFGPNNVSVPSGATPMATVMGNSYTSTLQFSPLLESHAGMYTCRLGSNARLAVKDMVTVNRPTITVAISESGSPVLGQSGYYLNCDVTGDENLSSTKAYQWTRKNSNIQTLVGTNSRLLSFSSLSLSDAGRYTCSVTVSSPYLNSSVTVAAVNDLFFQSVYLSLRSRVYNANGYILTTDIGEGDDKALLCFTDRFECCDTINGGEAQGEWFFPNGSAVGGIETAAGFYVNRGQSVVRLNQRSNDTLLSGEFCCQIRDSTSTNKRVCVNIIDPQSPSDAPCSANQIATTAGVTALIIIVSECLIAIPVILIALMTCCRRKSSGKGDIAVSANVSYGQVVLTSSGDNYEYPQQESSSMNNASFSYTAPAPYEIPVPNVTKS